MADVGDGYVGRCEIVEAHRSASSGDPAIEEAQ